MGFGNSLRGSRNAIKNKLAKMKNYLTRKASMNRAVPNNKKVLGRSMGSRNLTRKPNFGNYEKWWVNSRSMLNGNTIRRQAMRQNSNTQRRINAYLRSIGK